MKLSVALFFLLLCQVVLSQIQDKIDFISAKVTVQPNPLSKSIKGTVTYDFVALRDTESVFLDAIDMEFSNVILDSKKVKYSNDGKRITIKKRLKKGRAYTLLLDYTSQPRQTVYYSRWQFPDSLMQKREGTGSKAIYSKLQQYMDSRMLYLLNKGEGQIWTQGQGKYTSHWLPSFDDMTEKVEFDLSIIFNSGYEVFANGILKDKITKGGQTTWHFDMKNPMSSYLVAFVVGNFKQKTVKSSSGVEIGLYFEPKDSLKVEPTYRYTKQVFDFLEKEIGVPYPWQNYKQIPVQDFLYAGMENTGATVFSNTFVVDSVGFVDKNYVNVNAHEMAHQWFGNLVTEQSGEHHWLHEGFATFYAYLAEKEIFGSDYFYWRLWETANALSNFSGEGNGEALTNASAGSLTFYEKGAWALLMLKQRVGGEAFKEGIKNYLTKFAYKNVTIADFMWEMEKASGMKLKDFEEQWLQESEFPMEIAKNYLMENNASIKRFYGMKNQIENRPGAAEEILKAEWEGFKSIALKKQLLLEYAGGLSPSFLQKLLKEEGLKVRQAIVLGTESIPLEIKTDFETLLKDQSYTTIESALFRLWTDFPDQRKHYLDVTKDITGLPNKNVHMLWLALALVTPDYENNMKSKYFEELNGYTGIEHHFEVRLLAFQYLRSIGAFNDQTLKNLIAACNHHVWHFKKSSRKMLKDFMKAKENLARVEAIYPTLNLEQQQYLDKTLGR
ncbi:M1 family metallopeptidase [Flagellimonas flava]|uniref:Aminopeptidase N n=1 Tax=Flagellimonas flava TaxID=570519 RepID=A0A1M5IGI9_9FLAO|nr:M1 family metallopeptidase [Allomuricauda flava]SHG27428.1 aminopeptidase N [Allomuricauda flava]